MPFVRFPLTSRLTSLLAAAVAAIPSTVGLAATLTVTTLTDIEALDGQCSLREAIVAANTDAAFSDCAAGSGEDRIEFGVAGTIDLASNLPVVTASLVLQGPGVANLVVDGNNHRLLDLDGDPDGARFDVSHLVLRRGLHSDPGGCLTVRREDRLELHDARVLQCESASAGGGIAGDEAALVHVVRTHVANNTAIEAGGGIVLFGSIAPTLDGPAGVVSGKLVVEDSTVAGNQTRVSGGGGGGIGVALATLELRRSTVSGNSTYDLGGGIFALRSQVTIESSTIYGNAAFLPLPFGGGDRGDLGAPVGGGGLAFVGDASAPATATIHNSVVAGNLSGTGDNDLVVMEFATLTSLGWNAVGVNEGAPATFPSGLPNGLEDWVGTTGFPLDPGLGPLAGNGGPTLTRLPLAGSVVIDRGSCPGERRDQRGFGEAATGFRTVDDPLIVDADAGCDIGAIEAGAVLLPGILLIDGFESADTAAWSATVP